MKINGTSFRKRFNMKGHPQEFMVMRTEEEMANEKKTERPQPEPKKIAKYKPGDIVWWIDKILRKGKILKFNAWYHFDALYDVQIIESGGFPDKGKSVLSLFEKQLTNSIRQIISEVEDHKGYWADQHRKLVDEMEGQQ